ENLLYSQLTVSGTALPVIHRSYNTWIRELATSLAGGLGVPSRISYAFAPLEAVDAVPFLDDAGRQAYKDFLSMPKPRAFAVGPNGAWGAGGSVTPNAYAARF